MAENNYLYDLVTTLENKMKAVAAYDRYMQDAAQGGNRRLFEKIKRDDESHIGQLKQELNKALQGQNQPDLVRSGVGEDD